MESAFKTASRIFPGALNEALGKRYPAKYWNTIIAPWLIHFIQVSIERTDCLLAARKTDPQITVALLAPEFNFHPLAYNQFVEYSISDAYNLQLVGRLAKKLGVPGVTVERPLSPKIVPPSKPSADYRRNNVEEFILGAWHAGPADCLITDLPLSRRQLLLLGAAGLGRIAPLGRNPAPEEFDFKADGALRSRFSDLVGKSSPADIRLIMETAAEEIPILYLESHEKFRHAVDSRFPRSPMTLASSSGWIGNEILKFLAARCDNETLRVGIQHGGGYGSAQYMFLEELERRAVDVYYTWGWGAPGSQFLPPACLAKLKSRDAETRTQNKILFIANEYPSYFHRMTCVPRPPNHRAYWEKQLIFFNSLSREALNKIVYRPYYAPERMVKEWLDYYPPERRELESLRLRQSPRSESLAEAISESSLVVVDVNSTSFLETMAANVPTIAFWDLKTHGIRPSVREIFDDLRSASIFHDSPESAARQISMASFNPSQWWGLVHVQRARENFCKTLARRESTWLPAWRNALLAPRPAQSVPKP